MIIDRDALVTAHWYLCIRGAHKFYRGGSDWADLTQVGAIGLLKAAEQYDHARGTPFEAYAWLLIMGELMHYVRDHERIMRVPRRVRALEGRYTAASEVLTHRLGRAPLRAEIAAEMNVDPHVLDEVLLRGGSVVSLDALPNDGEPAGMPIEAWGVDERISLRAALRELGDRERRAVLGSFDGVSQTQLSAQLGVSQSYVAKIIRRALTKLQQKVA